MSGEEFSRAKHDLGLCSLLKPESVGPPGQRHFRLLAHGESGTAILWLEKEELYDLAVAVKQVLKTGVRPTGEPETSGDTTVTADLDFKVGRLSLGHDQTNGRYVLLAHISEDDDEESVALWAERKTLDRMADRAFEVHEAGRPRCPLCGRVSERGGVCPGCPRMN